MVKKGILKTNDIKLVIFDETDEIFARGFKERIY
jgi:superfamily II DNA/RNA helicase